MNGSYAIEEQLKEQMTESVAIEEAVKGRVSNHLVTPYGLSILFALQKKEHVYAGTAFPKRKAKAIAKSLRRQAVRDKKREPVAEIG